MKKQRPIRELKCVSCNEVKKSSSWYHLKKETPTCCKCYTQDRRDNHKESITANQAKYNSSTKGRLREKKYAKTEKGKESGRIRQARYKAKPEKYALLKKYWTSEARKESSRASYRRTFLKDPNYYRLKGWKRRVLVKLARPQCIQQSQITPFYQEAKRLELVTGIKYEVDHIIPLKGKLVSGLDIPENLQVLTRSENRTKNNQFDGTNDNVSWKEGRDNE